MQKLKDVFNWLKKRDNLDYAALWSRLVYRIVAGVATAVLAGIAYGIYKEFVTIGEAAQVFIRVFGGKS